MDDPAVIDPSQEPQGGAESDGPLWVNFLRPHTKEPFRALWNPEAATGGAWTEEDGSSVPPTDALDWELDWKISSPPWPGQTGVWLPIKTAPRRPGGTILACWEGRHWWTMLCWKFNPRIGRAYFGNPVERDDYDLVDDQPTHWLAVPEVPTAKDGT